MKLEGDPSSSFCFHSPLPWMDQDTFGDIGVYKSAGFKLSDIEISFANCMQIHKSMHLRGSIGGGGVIYQIETYRIFLFNLKIILELNFQWPSISNNFYNSPRFLQKDKNKGQYLGQKLLIPWIS